MYKKLFKKILIFTLLVALSSLIISLAAGEFIVKHIMPQETYGLARAVGINIFEKSPVISYTLRKNVKDYLHIAFTREFTHYLSTNSQGTRGQDFTVEKPPGTFRILFLGDSMTFGWGVEDNQTYPALVEKYLNAALLKTSSVYNKVETINAGFTDGQTLDSYYLWYKTTGHNFQPDLVVVDLFPYNDLSDMFYSNWEDVDKNGYPEKIISKTHQVDDGYLISIQKTNWKFEIPVLRDSHLFILFANALEKGAPRIVESIKKSVGIEQVKEEFSVKEATDCVYLLEKKYCPEKLWSYFDKSELMLSGIKQLSADYKQDLLVTIMASPDQAVPLSEKSNRPALLKTIEPQKHYRDFLNSEKINFLDLLPALSGDKSQNNFYERDGHMKNHGTMTVAKEITSFLIRENPSFFSPTVNLDLIK
ncbi:hypothetical protein A3I80_00015 [Candidatus Gottesmanbacteria bacterium RIFCSPLOWO2_02_FULL_40_10]|nr:MAG: hypothetical protein A3I80_00015 [Candidatus Gottesmanbacteria bacterium RIFCSPLOWO2_02_FULL_40_10]